jgi:hypothetical protein
MKTTIDNTQLTAKQQRFCDEYLIDMNATAAALRAGYSRATALTGQLMREPNVAAYLEQRTKEVRQKLQVSHEMIAAELVKMAFANLGDYFGDDGKLKPMNEMTDDAKAALWNLKITDHKDGSSTVQLRLCSKLSAIEKLARHTGFYKVAAAAGAAGKSVGVEGTAPAPAGAEEVKFRAEFERLEKWQDELVDIKMALDEREKALAKREGAVRGELGAEIFESEVESSELEASVKSDVVAEPVRAMKVVGWLAGQYTPDGYLIKTDMPADADKSDPYYDPYAGRYIEKKVGSMTVKSYLPLPDRETRNRLKMEACVAV